MIKSNLPQPVVQTNLPVVKRVRKVVPVTDELYKWIKDNAKQQ
jgi:hypothetical protein